MDNNVFQFFYVLFTHVWGEIFNIDVPGFNMNFKQFYVAWLFIGAVIIPLMVMLKGDKK